ncbi:MAG: ABC transporter permease [Chloroflexota bacterium]|nr:ABC transporter permease [Chloroflexota bacterium]
MQAYILRRVLMSLLVIFMVGVITFAIMHIVPGDPVAMLIGVEGGYDKETVDRMRHTLGLDKPTYRQFLDWFGGIFSGNLGTSIFTGHSVLELLGPRLEPSISLAIMGLTLAVIIGVPMGILAAWNANTWIDRAVMVFAVLGYSIPGFWLGFMFIWLLAVKLPLFPVMGYVPLSQGLLPFLRSLTLPAVTIAIAFIALIARMTRSSMLEVLREDYIRTARAKGLPERVIMVRHAFRPASIPVLTIIGLAFALAVTGVVVTETVFSIPGTGRLVVDAVSRRDFPVIQGVMMLVATAYVMVNLVVDVVYAYLDPRIRY